MWKGFGKKLCRMQLPDKVERVRKEKPLFFSLTRMFLFFDKFKKTKFTYTHTYARSNSFPISFVDSILRL